VPLGVDPEAVVGNPALLVTAAVEGLQVTQDVCLADCVNLAPAAADWRAGPVQQFVDDNAYPSKQQKRRLPALITEEQWRWRRDLNPTRG
jgi:hypothetical protein